MQLKEKRKRSMILIIFILITLGLVYYYPLQYVLAINKFNDYITLQGADDSDISEKRVYKDYKQDGYNISVVYKSDPDHRYQYKYFLAQNSKGGMRIDTMECHIYTKKNDRLDNFDDVVYKPLE
tara:strand:+ start:1731 stop:2102 length:372 start_codon:yes stop_codon:yes gene_type:complete